MKCDGKYTIDRYDGDQFPNSVCQIPFDKPVENVLDDESDEEHEMAYGEAIYGGDENDHENEVNEEW